MSRRDRGKAIKQDIKRRKQQRSNARRQAMSTISMNREAPAEFLSDVLITAFDGSVGACWSWFEPASKDWLKTSDAHTASEELWLSVHVRLSEDTLSGEPLFDVRQGFVLDHDSVAQGISRIINDDYMGVWRDPSQAELVAVEQGSPFAREHKWVDGGLKVHTGETARGVKDALVVACMDWDAGDIDADVADCIIQVAVFGKVIFS